ncbi:MAG: UDP-N-acetylmuramoyl-L-alanine--D-glutamate ligase [Clostridiales Family XIII bacterium]|nr:UDP-N-acetylmuramoyl-L-alanine--D-glutamate ligase [Clostridiales Family XIII bacterium]
MFEVRGKKVLVMGLGLSGKAAYDALVSAGASPAVYDSRDIEWEDPRFFKRVSNIGSDTYLNGRNPGGGKWDMVVMSPGVPPSDPVAKKAAASGARVVGELELAYLMGKGAFIAITGTNGKTTTTALTGDIFKRSGRRAEIVGNIGKPVITKALKADDDTWLVTEVSSFQLETAPRFRPKIAAFLNLTPDHMDRHRTMKAYLAAKANITANQKRNDFFVYNADDPAVVKVAEGSGASLIPFSSSRELRKGIFVRGGEIVIADRKGKRSSLLGASEVRIPGTHNLENALAAAGIGFAAGIDASAIAKSLRLFKGVEHRLELVGSIEGVRFVNDSKGTNPDASIKALEAMGESIILIAGGYDKNARFDALMAVAKGRVKRLLLLGATAEKMRAAAVKAGIENIDVVRNMGEAVRLGFENSRDGDTILLSPACASWDMYANFEERGKDFKKRVEELRGADRDKDR